MTYSEAVEKGSRKGLPSLLFQVSAFFIGLKSETAILPSLFQLIKDISPSFTSSTFYVNP